MAVSWGTRKALGRKYSVDPALLYELERLEKEYSLIPGREARALQARQIANQESQFTQSQAQQASQFGQTLAQQQETAEQQGKAGMVGTLGNVATTGMMLKYLAGSNTPAAGLQTSLANTQMANAYDAAMGNIPSATTTPTYGTGTVNPALTGVDTVEGVGTGTVSGMGAGAGLSSTVAPEGAAVIGGETVGAGAEGAGLAGAGMSAYLGPAAAGAIAPSLLNAIHKDSTENLGHNLTLGLVKDEKTANVVGSVGAGAAAGAAVGSIVPGVGTVIGGVIGGIVGGITSFFCFCAGTKVKMADGTEKDIKDIELLDEVFEGGIVNALGIAFADNIYSYHKVFVTGSHAVMEDGIWIRVKDSVDAIECGNDIPTKVYIVNNINHRLIINDITFADYGEVTNSEDMTMQERLDWLNEHNTIRETSLSVAC